MTDFGSWIGQQIKVSICPIMQLMFYSIFKNINIKICMKISENFRNEAKYTYLAQNLFSCMCERV